jgi:hypothetical protein
VENGTAAFAVPNAFHLERAEVKRLEVEEALTSHFGARLRIRLVEDDGSVAALVDAPSQPDEEDRLTSVDVADLDVAEPSPSSIEDRVKAAFPGAQEIADERVQR